MNTLKKYKYWLLIFIILESILYIYLSNEKQNKTNKYIEQQSSIITTNYNTIRSIYKKTPNSDLNTIDTFKQLKMQMEKFFEINIFFLIHKKDIKILDENYIQSKENPEYFYKADFLELGNKTPISIQFFPKKILKQIATNLKTNKSFTIYKFSDIPKIGTFIPIKDTKQMAYLVVYQKGPYIMEIQMTYIVLLLIGTAGIIFLIFLMYKLRNEKIFLEKKIHRKTKEFKALNENLENKVQERIKEQLTLLSLFDKGDNVLFKWKNDSQWSIEDVSQSVEKLFGYTQEEFLSKNVEYANIIHKSDLVYVIKEVDYAVKTNEDFFMHKPYRVIAKNGEEKWIKDYTVTVKNHRDEITHFVGYIHDITKEVNYQIELENEVKEKTKSLKELNENLEEQIKIEIRKNIEKEKLMFQQSKMASMGEMLGNIAHQWKQPLNAISISASSMQLHKDLGQLDDELFENGIKGVMDSTDFLSQTIDDFQNFLKPNKEIQRFDLENSVKKSLQLVTATFRKSSISTILDIETVEIKGIQGEFTQVILNIINNAKDILIEKNDPKDRFIFIDSKIQEDHILIFIKDNAGGIPEDIIKNIFDQYFTTKDTNGTGIGLHMSKEIIESHMNGKLEVQNDEFKYKDKSYKGAKFTITLPIEKEQD